VWFASAPKTTRNCRAVLVEPSLIAVSSRNSERQPRGISVTRSTAGCKHPPVRLPCLSAPLQSMTAAASRRHPAGNRNETSERVGNSERSTPTVTASRLPTSRRRQTAAAPKRNEQRKPRLWLVTNPTEAGSTSSRSTRRTRHLPEQVTSRSLEPRSPAANGAQARSKGVRATDDRRSAPPLRDTSTRYSGARTIRTACPSKYPRELAWRRRRNGTPHPVRTRHCCRLWKVLWSARPHSFRNGRANTSVPAVRSTAKADRSALQVRTSPLTTPKCAQPRQARTTEVIHTRQPVIVSLARHEKPTVASAPAIGSPSA